MTDNTRTELRRGLENLVRESLRESADVDVSVWGPTVAIGGWAHFTQVEVSSAARDLEEAPPLTTAQQLALSVLVGEPDRAVLSALCDCLIEQGHEYAAAVAEKARAEERERCAHISRLAAMDYERQFDAASRSGREDPVQQWQMWAADAIADSIQSGD